MISIKNVILPNKPLNNFELEEASKKLKIKCFRGVYLLDTLPNKPNNKECGIVNFDKSGGSGTHWVAWYKNGKNKIYFDSYGIQPPKEVLSIWEMGLIIILIRYNREGRYSVFICGIYGRYFVFICVKRA